MPNIKYQFLVHELNFIQFVQEVDGVRELLYTFIPRSAAYPQIRCDYIYDIGTVDTTTYPEFMVYVPEDTDAPTGRFLKNPTFIKDLAHVFTRLIGNQKDSNALHYRLSNQVPKGMKEDVADEIAKVVREFDTPFSFEHDAKQDVMKVIEEHTFTPPRFRHPRLDEIVTYDGRVPNTTERVIDDILGESFIAWLRLSSDSQQVMIDMHDILKDETHSFHLSSVDIPEAVFDLFKLDPVGVTTESLAAAFHEAFEVLLKSFTGTKPIDYDVVYFATNANYTNLTLVPMSLDNHKDFYLINPNHPNEAIFITMEMVERLWHTHSHNDIFNLKIKHNTFPIGVEEVYGLLKAFPPVMYHTLFPRVNIETQIRVDVPNGSGELARRVGRAVLDARLRALSLSQPQ